MTMPEPDPAAPWAGPAGRRHARDRRSRPAPVCGTGVRLYPPPPDPDAPSRGTPDTLDTTADGFSPFPVTVESLPPTPARPRDTTRLIVQVTGLQLLCIAMLSWLNHADRILIATAAVLPAVLALSIITVRSHTFGAWTGIWLSWRRRRRQVATVTNQGDPINPLWLLNRDLSIGSVKGFQHSDLGLLQLDRSWVAAAWATDGPRTASSAADGLTTLLDLAPSPAPGTTLYAVLQQAATGHGVDPQQQLTAWLSIRVEPLRAFPPGQALTAVPAMVRAEFRRLQQNTADGVLKLVPLDRSDLLSALTTTTEISLTPSATAETVSESWHLWQARGRFHHTFELRPGRRRPMAVLVALAMDLAGYDPDVVLTICIPYPSVPRQRTDPLPVIRLSHHNPVLLMNLAEEITDALHGEGAVTRPLSGRHGPALLSTSILASSDRT